MDALLPKEASTLLSLILGWFRGCRERVLEKERVAEVVLVIYTLLMLTLVLTNA